MRVNGCVASGCTREKLIVGLLVVQGLLFTL